jgi:hypothetical protein
MRFERPRHPDVKIPAGGGPAGGRAFWGRQHRVFISRMREAAIKIPESRPGFVRSKATLPLSNF